MLNIEFGLQDTERCEARRDTVEQWTIASLEKIRQTMLTQRDGIVQKWPELAERPLVTLPLCLSWRYITPPKGFHVVYQGEVTLLDNNVKNRNVSIRHTYATNKSDEVLCFSFGQFGLVGNGLQNTTGEQCKGDAVRNYRSCAPELVTYYEKYDIARLYGLRQEIEDKLKLSYKERPRIEKLIDMLAGYT